MCFFLMTKTTLFCSVYNQYFGQSSSSLSLSRFCSNDDDEILDFFDLFKLSFFYLGFFPKCYVDFRSYTSCWWKMVIFIYFNVNFECKMVCSLILNFDSKTWLKLGIT
ncbi:hypothetical protein MKX03_002296 [Papaver bracteatum]|nr:hypothetical protein MKX03_002296 [Papaver bracteatum]